MRFNHIHLNSVDSTNSWAKENADRFPRDLITIVTADSQTGGRGRFGRSWISPPEKNIYASFCFFEERDPPNFGNVSQIMGISAVEVIEGYGIQARLKWPNDLLIEGKKVGGILCETIYFGNWCCVIVGIGLNVNMNAEEFKKIEQPATSLFMELKNKVSTEEVLNHLSGRFSSHLKKYSTEGFSSFLPTYKNYLNVHPGEPMQFHDSGKVWKGVFHEIQQDGSLTMEVGPGTKKTFYSGEML